jgi:hypothetical protein
MQIEEWLIEDNYKNWLNSSYRETMEKFNLTKKQVSSVITKLKKQGKLPSVKKEIYKRENDEYFKHIAEEIYQNHSAEYCSKLLKCSVTVFRKKVCLMRQKGLLKTFYKQNIDFRTGKFCVNIDSIKESDKIIIDYIKDNYETKGISTMAKDLNVPKHKVETLFYKLNLKTPQEVKDREHWERTRKFIGVPRPPHVVEALRNANIKRMHENPNCIYSNCKSGFRDDIGLFVRSGWEANIIRFLNKKGIAWQYEPKRVKLKDGSTYLVDLKIEWKGKVTFIEVKGWWDNDSKKKVNIFREDNTLLVIDEKAYYPCSCYRLLSNSPFYICTSSSRWRWWTW